MNSVAEGFLAESVVDNSLPTTVTMPGESVVTTTLGSWDEIRKLFADAESRSAMSSSKSLLAPSMMLGGASP